MVGWAGWDHRQQATALAELFQRRKRDDGWGAERLTPLLAGLDELVPWLKQWHNEPDPSFGGQRVAELYASFVEAEARSLGLTLEDLRAWRPAKRVRRGKRAAGKGKGGARRAAKVSGEMLLEGLAGLAETAGEQGVGQRELAERLGVGTAVVAKAAEPLVADRVLELTSRRPKRFRRVSNVMSGQGAKP